MKYATLSGSGFRRANTVISPTRLSDLGHLHNSASGSEGKRLVFSTGASSYGRDKTYSVLKIETYTLQRVANHPRSTVPSTSQNRPSTAFQCHLEPILFIWPRRTSADAWTCCYSAIQISLSGTIRSYTSDWTSPLRDMPCSSAIFSQVRPVRLICLEQGESKPFLCSTIRGCKSCRG